MSAPEKSKARISIKELCVLSLLAAIMFASQVAFSAIPNIELVSLLVIICTLIYRYKALYVIYVFVLLEGLMWGFGVWWIAYLYIWTVLWLVTMLFHKVKSTIFWTVVAALYGLFFGLLTAFIQLFIGGPGAAIAYWVSGIPFDLLHCAGNAAVAIILFKPIHNLIRKIGT